MTERGRTGFRKQVTGALDCGPVGGAIPGHHTVVVQSVRQVPAKGGGEPQEEYVIPLKYTNPASSGLSVDIPPGGNKDIKIDKVGTSSYDLIAVTHGRSAWRAVKP